MRKPCCRLNVVYLALVSASNVYAALFYLNIRGQDMLCPGEKSKVLCACKSYIVVYNYQYEIIC